MHLHVQCSGGFFLDAPGKTAGKLRQQDLWLIEAAQVQDLLFTFFPTESGQLPDIGSLPLLPYDQPLGHQQLQRALYGIAGDPVLPAQLGLRRDFFMREQPERGNLFAQFLVYFNVFRTFLLNDPIMCML